LQKYLTAAVIKLKTLKIAIKNVREKHFKLKLFCEAMKKKRDFKLISSIFDLNLLDIIFKSIE